MTVKGPYVGGLSHVFILLFLHNFCAVVGMYRVTCLTSPNMKNFVLHFNTLLQNMVTHCHEELPSIKYILKRLFLNREFVAS